MLSIINLIFFSIVMYFDTWLLKGWYFCITGPRLLFALISVIQRMGNYLNQMIKTLTVYASQTARVKCCSVALLCFPFKVIQGVYSSGGDSASTLSPS